MLKSRTKTKAKARKKANIRKKTRLKVIIFVIVCALAAVTALVSFINSAANKSQNPAEVYSTAGQTVQLFENGNFSAILAHNTRKAGTYTKTADGNRTIVSFNINGRIEIGSIENNSLRIPDEWDDGHGHGNVLRKR
jgi:hypothetical protein